MNKVERINAAYDYLIWRKIIGGQEDVAAAMGSTQPNVSQALKGAPRVLTDKFIRRFCNAYPTISVEWVLYEQGEMLKGSQKQEQPRPTPELSIIELAATLIKENEALRRQLTDAISEVRTLREEMARDRDALMSIRASLSAIYPQFHDRLPVAAEETK
jgi:hypothetical protein